MVRALYRPPRNPFSLLFGVMFVGVGALAIGHALGPTALSIAAWAFRIALLFVSIALLPQIAQWVRLRSKSGGRGMPLPPTWKLLGALGLACASGVIAALFLGLAIAAVMSGASLTLGIIAAAVAALAFLVSGRFWVWMLDSLRAATPPAG